MSKWLHLHAVQGLAKTSQCLTEAVLFTLALRSMAIDAAVMDGSTEAESQVTSTGRPIAGFIGDIVLHTSAQINLNLFSANRATQPRIELPCVLAIAVAQRVVNVLFWAVYAQTFLSDFELFGGIAMSKKR